MTGDPVLYEGADLEALATLRRYRRWILDTFTPYLGGRTVEFGAGIGNVAEGLRPHVAHLDLVEPSANLIGRLADRFANDGAVAVHNVTLEDFSATVDDGAYRAVVLVNVLEHIEDDAAALDDLHRMLEPGGHLLLFVPALRFLFSDLDRLVGHFRRYTRTELTHRVAGAGFDIRVCRYFDLLGIAPWYLMNTLLGATTFDPRLAGLYDAVGVPVTRFIEGLARPPVGKSLILVARRT